MTRKLAVMRLRRIIQQLDKLQGHMPDLSRMPNDHCQEAVSILGDITYKLDTLANNIGKEGYE